MAGIADDSSGAIQLVRDLLKRVRDAAPMLHSDPSGFDSAMDKISDGFMRATAEHGELELNISTNRILLGEDEVYKSEARTNNLAFDLFRQGLRRLGFKPGLGSDEVTDFVRRFAECRSADQVDEDFVTMMWQDSSPHIAIVAIDSFTEKIFMSEAEFVRQFRSVLDDVAPGIFDLEEEDSPDAEPRVITRLDDAERADRADLEQRKIRKSLADSADSIRTSMVSQTELSTGTDHLVHLNTCRILAGRIALSNAELQGIWVKMLSAYLEMGNWQAFADALRTVSPVLNAGFAFAPNVGERLDKIRKVVAGRDLAEQVAAHLNHEEPNFTSWVRWFFYDAGELTAPRLLELINGCTNQNGRDWLKDLLRRQGTTSLEPWAERMRDPNPGIVLEVIDVIMNSGLGDQAESLLVEALRHGEGAVRHRAVESLITNREARVREALLPMLKDPDPKVRRTVIKHFVDVQDKSVGTYLANIVRSHELFALEEDEQRELFEGLARLTGERYLDSFRERLGLDEAVGLGRLMKRGKDTVTDNITRRAVISGLGVMKTPSAIGLIREIQTRADLSLAAHCDVVLRLLKRVQTGGESDLEVAVSGENVSLEDVGLGRSRMGAHVLFTVEQLGLAEVISRGKTQRPAVTSLDGPKSGPQSGHVSQRGEELTVPQSGPAGPHSSTVGAVHDLGPNPLLGHSEVFDIWDRVRLSASPDLLSGPRFVIADIDINLVGVDQKTVDLRDRRKTTMPPVRIVERSRGPASQPPPKKDGEIKGILEAYLEMPGVQNEPLSAVQDTPAAPVNVDNLLQDYLDLEVGEEAPAKAPAAFIQESTFPTEASEGVPSMDTEPVTAQNVPPELPPASESILTDTAMASEQIPEADILDIPELEVSFISTIDEDSDDDVGAKDDLSNLLRAYVDSDPES